MADGINILVVEPFLGGSHARWVEGLASHSRHQVQIMGLPARHWKWRMHGGAVTLAEEFMALSISPDLILATDMLDLSTFLSLTRSRSQSIPVAIYFHENQLTYPWSPTDQDVQLKRDNHYAFINYTSALVADHVYFNSQYHLDSFLNALPVFLKSFPDKRNFKTVERIRAKSSVLHLGMDLRVDPGTNPKATLGEDLKIEDQSTRKANQPGPKDLNPTSSNFPDPSNQIAQAPLLLWNHRWEYDKGPEEFFNTLIELKAEGIPFQLAVLGQSYAKTPPIFEIAKEQLADRIVQWGYSDTGYTHWLQQADCLPVTSRQDFFGGSVVEAMFHNCWPLLPDRLAYPEHIPEAFRKDCLYQEGKSKEALKKYLLKKVSFPDRIIDSKTYSLVSKEPNASAKAQTPPPEPRQWVQHYDWKNSAPQYDAAFGNLLSKA